MSFGSQTIDEIHQQLLSNAHIQNGYRDKYCLTSITEGMEIQFNGKQIYPTLFEKSAFMFEGIVRLHPFIDGNKRTALASIQEYLLENGYIFIMPLSAVRFTIRVASITTLENDRITSLIQNISSWISSRTAPINKITEIKEIYKIDIKLLHTLKKISKSRRDREMLDDVIGYWVGNDIYPDNKYYFKDFVDFYANRQTKILGYLRKESKRK